MSQNDLYFSDINHFNSTEHIKNNEIYKFTKNSSLYWYTFT